MAEEAQAPEPSFTSDFEFDELVDQDKPSNILYFYREIEGFVCFFETPGEVGEKNYHLFKFGISNGTKKIMCLVWGKELIAKLQPDIVINKIINIDGAHCKLSKYSKKLKDNGCLVFEVIIQPTTKMTFKGLYAAAASIPPPVPAREVNFETIANTEGKIAIDRYIKTDFASIPSQYHDATYGCGSITDGTYKITVNITNFQPNENFHKGAAARVTGEVNNNNVKHIFILFYAPIAITCKNIDMPHLQLRRGVRTFRRVEE
ncbi:hypothetical protein TSAR_002670 [Trichomalopsis sarcophagae]|uniref:Uncharacterized protein n=1 Tax=Trichomalopsis sarcophagae TaxID=543379 RepID=A0A232EH19_9HYME|nr:hypothetical protein TSAR_002670 [Trichomalopsis sarcophagae]